MSPSHRIDILDRAGFTMPADDQHPDLAARMIGLRLLVSARMVGVLVAVTAGALAEDRWVGYWALAAVLVVGQGVIVVVAFSRHWERSSGHLLPLLGLLVLGGLVAASGGFQSPAAQVIVVFPAVGAFIFDRGRVLVSGVFVLTAVAAAFLPDLLRDEPDADRALITEGAALALATVIGVAIATGRTILRGRAADLYVVRRRLLLERLTAAATERRRISAELGAGPLQLLLAARQDLEEVGTGTADRRDLARCRVTLLEAADRLRQTVVELRSPREGTADGPQTTDDARTATRMLAVLRVSTTPLLAAAALLGEPDRAPTVAVPVLLVAMGMTQAVALAWCFSIHWKRFPAVPLAVADMAALGVLIALTGGAQSAVLAPAALLPMTLLLLGPPRVQLAVVGVLVAGIVASAVPDVLQGEDRAAVMLAVALLTLLWTTAVAQLGSVGRSRLELRTATLENARQQLLAESVASQDGERAAVARALHDDALQLVLAAAQELERRPDPGEDPVSLALAHTTTAAASLREGAEVLHPSALEHGGLGPALSDIARRASRLGGSVAVVDVDPIDARHDELVIGLTRELVTNAAKHALATTVRVTVGPEDDGVLLLVSDDGRGMPPDRPRQALAEGHVGLASCVEQVEAAGGRLDLRSAPGEGTEVRIRLP